MFFSINPSIEINSFYIHDIWDCAKFGKYFLIVLLLFQTINIAKTVFFKMYFQKSFFQE